MKPGRNDPDLGASEPTPQQRPIAYTTQRFAELIHGPAGTSISERTVRDWCATGIIPATKMGNRWIIPADAIDQLFRGSLPDNVTPFRLK